MNEDDLLKGELSALGEALEEMPDVDDASSSDGTSIEPPSTHREEQRGILSPTLMNVPSSRLPRRDLVCLYCPHAMWMLIGRDLVCRCRVQFEISFSTAAEDQTPILICDGYFLPEEARM